jgi:hypothetical protein
MTPPLACTDPKSNLDQSCPRLQGWTKFLG